LEYADPVVVAGDHEELLEYFLRSRQKQRGPDLGCGERHQIPISTCDG
jgi:hypothetical protein